MSAWHERHVDAAKAIASVSALPSHAVLEVYSVITRLPAGFAIAPATAAELLARRFPEAPLRLSARGQRALVERFAEAGVAGGASYDGLVALEADAHDEPLLTLDRRAQDTYLRLGVAVRLIQ